MSKFVTENAKKVIEFWSKEWDTILDPFAWRTRGLIATLLNRNYIWFDVDRKNLLNTLVEYFKLRSNKDLVDNRFWKIKVVRKSGELIHTEIFPETIDFIYTCPPYWNIEKYPSTEWQLSDIKSYEQFLGVYREILHTACDTLKPGRFFAIVIANFRKDGSLIDFRGDTSSILKEKLTFHDEIILEMSPAKRHPLYPQAITNLNTLKTHEYLLVFRKEATKDEKVLVNNEINFARPLVTTTQEWSWRETLFWSWKIDFTDTKYQKPIIEKVKKEKVLKTDL